MASTSSFVPDSCKVLSVIEWLPKDDTLPGFVVLTFLGFFVIGAILALLIVRCAAREVEVKRRRETSSYADHSKQVWVFGYKVYFQISLVLVCVFLVMLLVVQIWFATRDEADRKRSEDRMSDRFTSSVWIWVLVVAVFVLPILGYLALRCIFFPGIIRALQVYSKAHSEKRRKKTTKEHIVLVHMQQTKNTTTYVKQQSEGHSTGLFTQNKVSPLPYDERSVARPADDESYSRAVTTSIPSLRSEATVVDDKNQDETENYGHSIIEILTKESSEKMEVELHGQDLKSVIAMEDGLLKQKGKTFLSVWRMILDVLFNNGRISEVLRREFIAKLEQSVEDIQKDNEDKKEKESRRIKLEVKDSGEREEALENIHSSYSKKMNSDLIALQTEAANTLKEKSQLSEEEATAIILKVKSNLAASERFFVEEQTRQSMVLQQKQLRRQALVQLRDQMNDQEKEVIESSPEKHRELLEKLCQDHKLLDSQKEEILSEYEQNLMRLQEHHEQNIILQQNKLATKLKQKREKKMQLLKIRQQNESEEHYKTACRQVSGGEMTLEAFVQEQTELNRRHTMEKEECEHHADKSEAEELERLRQHLEEEREKEIKSYESRMLKKLASLTQLSPEDMNGFIEEHRRDMALYNEKLEESKNQQRLQLKEKLQARKARLERERAQHKNEQTQLITQQEEVIEQVLKMQVGLTEEMRKQVMVEHEQNLLNLNNHLQITRLRQQKRLEERLAQRKAKLVEMKKCQEDEMRSNAKDDPQKQHDLMKQQNRAYEDEVQKLEDEHDHALENLRRRLALETEAALKEQDKKLGGILGKYQVGVARREEIIRRQNETIKAIENKMVDKLTRDGVFAENASDKILKQHQRQIMKLQTKMNEAKEVQEKSMREKLEAKRLKKERALSAKHASRVEEQRTRGVRSATRVMMNFLAETQLKQKLEDLRREMDLELAKQKEELNKVMEEKLTEELQVHERNFITQLASISNIKEDEISNICKEAIKESGGDQRISKDFQKRFRSIQQDSLA